MSDETVGVPPMEYLTLVRGALERGYRGLVKAEQLAADLDDAEWQMDLRGLRVALKLTAKAHFTDLEKKWDREIQLGNNRHVAESKYSEDEKRRILARLQHETYKEVAHATGVSERTLRYWKKNLRQL